MSKKCIVVFPDGSECSNFRSPQYIDYCYTCGKAGRRKPCIFVSSKGKVCPRKAKKGNYCGYHKHLDTKIEAYMDIEKIEIILRSKEEYEEDVKFLNLKKEIYEYREKLLSSSFDEREKQKIDKLLIIKHPELIEEWDFKLNKEIDIKNITYGMNVYVYWKCPKNIHESYYKKVSEKIKWGKCKKCSINSKKYNENFINKLMKSENKNNASEIGDETEKFILDLLNSAKKYKSVDRIGNIGGQADIKITHQDNSENFIQVKTLTLVDEKINRYNLNIRDKYPDDMLIVGVDKKRKFFVLTFAKNMLEIVSLSFNYEKSKYKDIMYKNIEEFKKDLINKIPLSCKENNITETVQKEILSINRLKIFCKDKNLSYQRNNISGNVIDGYINAYKIQNKYVSYPIKNKICYKINSEKHAGSLKGKSYKSPYEKGDFDFMIIEVSGRNNDKEKEIYLNNFCIIPSSVLTEKGILKTCDQKGKTGLSICPPDYEKDHWTKKYWNNFSQLLN